MGIICNCPMNAVMACIPFCMCFCSAVVSGMGIIIGISMDGDMAMCGGFSCWEERTCGEEAADSMSSSSCMGRNAEDTSRSAIRHTATRTG